MINVAGEASWLMNMQEMGTAVQFRAPVKQFILNNERLGMVRQWQQLLHGERYSQSWSDSLPDFVKLAESYGHVGMRIDKPEDVEGALKEAFAMKDRLVFMDFITDLVTAEMIWNDLKWAKNLDDDDCNEFWYDNINIVSPFS